MFMCELVLPHGSVSMSLPVRLSGDLGIHLRPCAYASPYTFADAFSFVIRMLSVRR